MGLKRILKSPLAMAILMALIVCGSCSSPADEAWMKITSFQQEGLEEAENVSVVYSDLNDGSDDEVDIVIANFTTSASGTEVDIGIAINLVEVTYQFGDYAIPAYGYPVSYYLPANASSDDGETSSEVIIGGIPIAPVSLKSWLLNPANFPESISCCRFNLSCEVTIHGETGEGLSLATTGYLTVVFN